MNENDLHARLDASVATLIARAARGMNRTFAPRVGVVLGSGLGAFGDTVASSGCKIPYEELGFPTSGVVGHAGALCLGTLEGDHGAVPVACMQGRVHGYEGHEPDRVVFAVRALARWGCRTFVLTNAAGGVNAAFEPGDLMLLTDHLNLTGKNPLIGPNDERIGPRFPDMSEAYDRGLREKAHAAAQASSVVLREGVYAGLSGPSYETPAEIRMLRALGADAVGMSTVAEVIALRHLGARCVAISCITNKGAGLSATPLSHGEVQEVADRTRHAFVGLLGRLVSSLGHTGAS